MTKVWNGTAWVSRDQSPYRLNYENGVSTGLSKAQYETLNNKSVEGLTYNPETSFGDTIKSWFTPSGENGTSLGGNVLSGLGTVVGIGGTLADVYYKRRADKREEDAAKYAKERVALADKNVATFAANVGNGATYNGMGL